MAKLDKKFDGRYSVVGIAFRYVVEGSVFENLSRGVQIVPAPLKVPEALSSSLTMGNGLFLRDTETRARRYPPTIS